MITINRLLTNKIGEYMSKSPVERMNELKELELKKNKEKLQFSSFRSFLARSIFLARPTFFRRLDCQ